VLAKACREKRKGKRQGGNECEGGKKKKRRGGGTRYHLINPQNKRYQMTCLEEGVSPGERIGGEKRGPQLGREK